VFGILIGQLGSLLIRIALPQLPAWPPLWATLASILVALTTGMIAGLLPATRAARLDPIKALSGK
jgi:putative ABC transport system permease protein